MSESRTHTSKPTTFLDLQPVATCRDSPFMDVICSGVRFPSVPTSVTPFHSEGLGGAENLLWVQRRKTSHYQFNKINLVFPFYWTLSDCQLWTKRSDNGVLSYLYGFSSILFYCMFVGVWNVSKDLVSEEGRVYKFSTKNIYRFKIH